MGPGIKEPIQREIDELITPNHIVYLNANDNFLNNRIKGLSEQKVQVGKHYSEADMKRRLDAYRKVNEAPNGDPSICDFFREYQNKEIKIQESDIGNSNLGKVA